MARKRPTLSSRSTSTLVLLLVVFFHVVTVASINPEAETLIKFKESLKNAGALSNWDPSKSPCDNWNGVLCEEGHVWGLKLEGMGLSGVIDVDTLSKLTELRTVSFMNNAFDEMLPNWSKLGMLKSIYLSNNKFDGEILPSTFDGMMSLKKLHLDNNAFSGSIPSTLATLSKLVELRLENNGFQGEIPKFEQDRLREFNVSHNQLVGQIPQALQHMNPTSFSGNPDLCGAPLQACSSKKTLPLTTILIVAVLVTLALAALLAVLIILHRRKKPSTQQTDRAAAGASTSGGEAGAQPKDDLNRMERGQGSLSPDMGNKPGVRLTFLRDGGDRFDMSDLLKASAEVLGSGMFGSTYKAALNSGKVMVVKRFRQMSTVSREEFNEHMRRLGRLSQDNVLPIIAFYYRKEEKLLVAEYVENVSLAVQLHGNKSKGQPTPDWPTRLNIVKGVAKGLQYLYHELPSLTAPHGHLKSSNVLLDASFKPLLTDYGLVPIMNQEHAQANMISYKSPESKATGRITRKSDVFSLGILILEILTGRFPWDANVDVADYVAAVESGGGGVEVFDKDMAAGVSQGEMKKLLMVGLSCCQADVDKRPEIKEVVEKLEEIKEKDVDDDFYSTYASEGDMRSSRGLSDDFKTINI
ncbi:actin-regulating kinase prk1 [Castilleja foliolosa]|uniref:Actin-regulating kinase prk1 n=1 Tax=Castilleja foliolosa TaxID=1961234 RepID=A0ABD3C2Z6_9LAMI